MPTDGMTGLAKALAEFTQMMYASKGKGKGDKGKGEGKGKDEPINNGKGGPYQPTAGPMPEPPLSDKCEAYQVGRCSRVPCRYKHETCANTVARYWWRKSILTSVKGKGKDGKGKSGKGKGKGKANQPWPLPTA